LLNEITRLTTTTTHGLSSFPSLLWLRSGDISRNSLRIVNAERRRASQLRTNSFWIYY
jgi:hypothetical protein